MYARTPLALAAALLLSLPASATPAYIPLDFIPSAVSADGSVVVGRKVVSGVNQAVRWVNGVAQVGGFQPPSGPAIEHWQDVSADGSVMLSGQWLYANGAWTQLPFPGGALSGDGTTVLGVLGGHPAVWKNGVTTPLPSFVDPDLQNLSLGGISHDGTVMGGAISDGDPFDPEPGFWLYRGLGYLELPMQNNRRTTFGVSPDGGTIGAQNNLLPALWQNGVLTQLELRYALSAWVAEVTNGGELAFGSECAQTAECLDPFGIPGPGLTSENVVWHDGEIVSLLDYLLARGIDAPDPVGDAQSAQVIDLGTRGRVILGTYGFSEGWLAVTSTSPSPAPRCSWPRGSWGSLCGDDGPPRTSRAARCRPRSASRRRAIRRCAARRRRAAPRSRARR